MSGRTMDVASKAESAFVMWSVSQGWEVTKPIHHAQGYDFVIRRSPLEKWQTVQVKAAYQGKTGRGKPTREVSLRRCNEKGSHPYKEGDFDWLFVWDGMESMWFLPWEQVMSVRSSITLGDADHINRAEWMVKI